MKAEVRSAKQWEGETPVEPGLLQRKWEQTSPRSCLAPLHQDCLVCHNGEYIEEFNLTLPHMED